MLGSINLRIHQHSNLLSFCYRTFLSVTAKTKNRQNGRDQEENAGDEAGEGQRVRPCPSQRTARQGCQPPRGKSKFKICERSKRVHFYSLLS